MANPADKTAASQGDLGNGSNKEQTLESKINSIVTDLTKDDKGQYVLPEELSEVEKFAVIAEKRRRDTQAGFTRASQETKALKAEKAALLNKVSSAVTVELTATQAEELEELKFSDPDAWRKKVNAYEQAATAKQQQEIAEELKQVSTSTLAEDELEQRGAILEAFNQENPDFELTDEIIANDIPPRIVKKLETGKISFEAFLQECYDYTKTGKVVAQTEQLPKKQPNLSKIGGGSKPEDNANKQDAIQSYKTEIY